MSDAIKPMPISEEAQAMLLAERILDKPYIDPDGDICLLARQLLRAHEKIEALKQEAHRALFGAKAAETEMSIRLDP